jgi:hypothetical protein
VTLNLSKSGGSLSFGPRGAKRYGQVKKENEVKEVFCGAVKRKKSLDRLVLDVESAL